VKAVISAVIRATIPKTSALAASSTGRRCAERAGISVCGTLGAYSEYADGTEGELAEGGHHPGQPVYRLSEKNNLRVAEQGVGHAEAPAKPTG